ncbi:unnamed protein product [Blepharisma stoltei]|uniref:Uncharacterized protein n=1 Tax=Blepharisma stoltei TaxID=1481888 RepID=A0AAU9K468_9CILI|nr:unnamed protein product [Blepharisma stoltei]
MMKNETSSENSEQPYEFASEITPQFSSPEKKSITFNGQSSDEAVDYYSYLSSFDKHTESIIPSRDAEKVQAKKQKEQESPSKDQKIKEQLEELRDQSIREIELLKRSFYEKEKELEEKSVRIENLRLIGPSPIYAPDPFESERTPIRRNQYEDFGGQRLKMEEESLKTKIKEAEIELREEIEEEFFQEKNDMIARYQAQTERAIKDTKNALDQFWKKRMQDLERELQATESKFFINPAADEESIQEFYDQQLKDKIEEEVDRLHREIDKTLKVEYDNLFKKRVSQTHKRTSSKLKQSDIDKFKEQLEIEFEVKLYSEKELWKRELMPLMIDECRNKAKLDIESSLYEEEIKLREEAKFEMEELIEEVKKESENVVLLRIKKIDDDEKQREIDYIENLQVEAQEELRKEQDFRLKEALTAKLRERLEKEIRHELEGRIEMEVKLRKEDQFRQELLDEIEFDYEQAVVRLKTDIQNKILNLEEEFAVNHNHIVLEEVEKKLLRREKELNIDYMKKLEKMKKKLSDEFEEAQSKQAANSAQLLEQEKAEVARLRSQLNVLLSKVKESRKNEIASLKSQEEMLEKKLREIQYAQQCKEESLGRQMLSSGSEKILGNISISRQQSPPKETASMLYSPKWGSQDQDIVRSLPKPLLPPSLLSTLAHESPKKLNTIEPPSSSRKLLKYSSAKELVSELILKNLEEAKQQAWALLEETESPPELQPSPSEPQFSLPSPRISPQLIPKKPSEPKSKHKRYHDLLNQRHGIIEPRRNKV